jgi:arginyl-tRNA synthetase
MYLFQVRKQGIDHDRVEKVIGKAYLILTDFSRPRRTDYVFSWHEISSKDGIAFLLLYCHARLCRLDIFMRVRNRRAIVHLWIVSRKK